MRGLAFPTNAAFDRETSYDHGTPSAKVDDIPIDPALSGPAIEPAILGGENGMNDAPIQHFVPFLEQYTPRQYSQEPRQYPQGPQGDPFAPLPPPAHLPIEEEPRPIPKPVKRKRKPRREEECGFCQGNDGKNKDGQPEVMATCEECSRSGHPSCMELGEVGEVIRSYSWKCIECKTCEICQEKGDDERILFCDFCDRGWHMDCIEPPIEESPPGRWYCLLCPQLGPDSMYYDSTQPQPQILAKEHNPRESSVASSSRSLAYPTKLTRNLKGKGNGAPSDDSGLDSDSDSEPETPALVKTRGRSKSNKKSRARPRKDSDDQQPSPVRPTKRVRVRVHSPATPLPRIRLRLSTGKGKEREEERGLFDDILSVDDRDTSKTTIEFVDKQRFERSRLSAEEKLAPPPPLPLPSTPEVYATPGPSSRPLRSSHPTLFPIPTSTPGLSASPPPPISGPSQPHVLRIRTIRFGQFDIQTWYDAPFPEEYANTPDGRMWICEFCLKYMKSRFGAVRHRMKCKARHPPGDEIYRDGATSIFEVDGRKNKIYCQNLCLLSKMFLDHKSLFYDVEPFLFYVMTEVDDVGARFVGYFSKEKRSPKDYNVSCIMTLPVRQRQGWGSLLIDFSYLLSKKEQRLGSPEKPLSGLGALGYKNYWTLAIMRFLETAPDHPRLEDFSTATSMTIEDVYNTLIQRNMISTREVTSPPVRPSPGQSIKYPKGRKNGVARRHLQRTQTQDEENSKSPFVAPKEYDIRWDRKKVEEYLNMWEGKGYLRLKPEKLKWSPFLLARMKKTDTIEATEMTGLATSGEQAQEHSAILVNGTSSNDHGAHSLFADDGTPVDPVNSVTLPHVQLVAQAPEHESQEPDVKSEDLGTPLTSLTSRQSVPSDDTIFLTDSIQVHARGAGKESDVTGGIQDTEPVMQAGLLEQGGDDADADAEYEEDLDADGEYEEDAEAEPDVGTFM